MDKGKRISGAAREQLAVDLRKVYERGVSIRTLAGGLGRSYGFVHRLLSESGTTLRRRGGTARA
ncbi:helix-turn-helix domain-containing protein [Streptomyces sp. SP18CS02]|uniref:helix-turn-helix domain-containing protein n=1 Tax=Streptomyces sp. SP18CS02 TaxID=3002531 RepID=UPI002E7A8C8F|nr:helix-turn-helix domain-containing protein [Streptomyces sp. SP18CS02]MEE1750992.1 helix-turn-helix domain-containing protein [Streptomyces sp. SP18CS02]